MKIPGFLSAWDSLNQTAQRVPLTAIMNPSNGPSTTPNADYSRAVTALRNAGGLVIGYVYSSYTTRAIAEVKTDIDRQWRDTDRCDRSARTIRVASFDQCHKLAADDHQRLGHW